MGTYLEMLPSGIKDQIVEITKSSGLEVNEESVELMAEGWIEKQRIFEEKIKEFGMLESGLYEKDDARGVLLLTYSGSLINLSPIIDDKRKSEYTSIGIRSDVPDSAFSEDTILVDDVQTDEICKFEKGPVESTSQIFKIAVVDEDLSPEEEQETIQKATTVIIEEFVDINKTIIQSN